MDEQKTQPENTTPNTDSGDNSQGLNPLERGDAIVKRLEEAEKRIDEKTAKLQELEANRLLSGTAGGRVEPAPPKKLTDEEYTRMVEKGITPQE